MIYGNTVGGSGGGSGIGKTYIIQDAAGNELVGVVTDTQVIFDATANDIRAGKVAATQNGVTTGEKEIPAYHTSEGYVVVTAGEDVKLTNIKNYEYTKMQALICAFNSNVANSVATEKVCIDNSVYTVSSTSAISTVVVDTENKSIDFGLTNTSGTLQILRYFMYKEIY